MSADEPLATPDAALPQPGRDAIRLVEDGPVLEDGRRVEGGDRRTGGPATEPGTIRGRHVVGDLPAARAPVTGSGLKDTTHRLFNRELSWLAFNERVLALAANPDLPLLERCKFLAITADNLDEFLQVRVAGLMEQVASGIQRSGPDGLRPKTALRHIRAYIEHQYGIMTSLFRDELVPALEAEGIRFSDWSTLDDDDRLFLDQEFEERVFPVLTPLAVDPAHPFPWISNLSLNLAVFVRDPRTDETLFARVKVPPLLDRFIVLPDGERFVPIEQVIAAHLDRLFPGMQVVGHHVFRVTRNADLVVEEEEADDLLLAIQSELTRQRFGRVVRLEVEPSMTDSVMSMLAHELGVEPDNAYVVASPLDLSGLWSLYALDRPELKYPDYRPVTPARLQGQGGERPDIFGTIRQGDVLLHHPYDDFTTTVAAFIEAAARDPQVLAIKQTLYRTSGAGSPIVKSLVKAAERGKQVVALVELKARFDEQSNIERARVMEEAGVHVVYGVANLKTHTKTALVVRREDDGRLRRYFHVGTGNYNDRTARVYEDLSILSCDPDIGADLSDLFNLLSGYSNQDSYRRLLIAPKTFRPRMTEMIRAEAAAEDGHIVAKMNSLVDPEIIQELYAASRSGARVDLIVRGTCCLRPGIPGLSENITVRSIVGRYLEHSRIFRFGSARRGLRYFVGSGDWMPRNLDRRVEAIAPVDDPRLRDRLEQVLRINLEDDILAWTLQPDGRWIRVPTSEGLETHVALQRLARARARAVE